jgi:hypothetical protein
MSKIKSVDFKITASGNGVVNWNGSFKVYNPSAEDFVSNHQFPKMRNIDPLKISRLDNKDLEKVQLIVSQNCFRHEIFKNETSNLKSVNINNVEDVLTSLVGLVRGYVIADDVTKLSLKRKSSLLLEDLVDSTTVLRYEQFSNSGERGNTSIYSKTNVDETNYIAYGSIVIEDLQFIVLEDTFGRSAYKDVITIQDGLNLANKLTSYLKSLDFEGNKNPQAIFKTNYVRIGSIMKTGEAGVLLNEDAIDLVVNELLNRIGNACIRQSKGYLIVNKLDVDYNSGKAMRIKFNPETVNQNKNQEYEIYYENIEVSEEDFLQKQKEITIKKDKLKKEKAKKENKNKKEENKTEDSSNVKE